MLLNGAAANRPKKHQRCNGRGSLKCPPAPVWQSPPSFPLMETTHAVAQFQLTKKLWAVMRYGPPPPWRRHLDRRQLLRNRAWLQAGAQPASNCLWFYGKCPTYVRHPSGWEQNRRQLELRSSVITTREPVFDEETIWKGFRALYFLIKCVLSVDLQVQSVGSFWCVILGHPCLIKQSQHVFL